MNPSTESVRYRTIVADPPWPYRSAGEFVKPVSDANKASSVERYGSMSMADLYAIDVPADDAAHLYLWTTNSFMVEAHELAKAWGFTPKTILTWVKTHHDDRDKVSMKMGYYFRGATEHVLFAVRGTQRLIGADALPTAFLWPRTPHSVKPDAFYDLVEESSPAPRLELFARVQRLGWDTWGNEALEHVQVVA